jgi:hypothetical protein
MTIRLASGAIIVTENKDIIEQHLKYGGVEVKETTKPAPKKKEQSE